MTLKFPEISHVVAETLERMDYKEDTDIETILAIDRMARLESASVVLETTGKSKAGR